MTNQMFNKGGKLILIANKVSFSTDDLEFIER